mmetsp:Transcript_45067/g.130408  ORF Transcript_45067/g.130408 Transcript_45067/m.130408 type:complete len:424 (-) Transcript_45067:279-1550(-)
MSVHWAWLALLALSTGSVGGDQAANQISCPGAFSLPGVGSVSLVPTGWTSGVENMSYMQLEDGGIKTVMGSRAYFASTCTAGVYDNKQYLALDLRGKTFRYTTDMSKAGCGCNAALYLTNLAQNDRPSECGDHYCDANDVCGESCAEIDIQEGSRVAWHSTLHTSADHTGLGKGIGGGGPGWSGPRDWSAEDYGPGGRCVDTNFPFNVSAYFPVDDQGKLEAMEITLGQAGRECLLWTRVGGYSGMAELDAALAKGMTPIVSYWSSDEMLWMDGKGMDSQGPCWKDLPDRCGEAVRFYGFSVTPAFPATTATTTTATTTAATAAVAVRRWHLGIPGVDLTLARAFCAGAAAVLAVQMIGVLLAWAVWSIIKRPAETADPVVSPLKNRVSGSSQSLLLLAESGEGLTRPRMPRPSSRDVMVATH